MRVWILYDFKAHGYRVQDLLPVDGFGKLRDPKGSDIINRSSCLILWLIHSVTELGGSGKNCDLTGGSS